MWTGPYQGDESVAWHQEGEYPFKALVGGDGMHVQIDTRDNNTVYTGYQFGNYFRIDKNTGKLTQLSIEENIGEEKLRWNWNTPILISKSSQDILYWGSNKLHRSLNKGETWQTISGDLTFGKKEGDIAYGTLTSIDESPLQFGLIYTGSDDGMVSVTQDGGKTWSEIGHAICTQLNIPEHLWVSRVIASRSQLGRVYVTLNGYRNDNFKAYVFVSDDYGVHWKSISSNLPSEPVNVIREDNGNENILYLGTDYGLYVSLDAGSSWMRWNNGMPNVAVHDMVIQEREKHLVVGTHGRSIFIGDLSLIQELDALKLNTPISVLTDNDYMLPRSLGKKPDPSSVYYRHREMPTLNIPYFSKQAGVVTIKITDSETALVFESQDSAKAGLNFFHYNYTVKKPLTDKNKKSGSGLTAAEDGNYYIRKGTYTITLTSGAASSERKIEIKQR